MSLSEEESKRFDEAIEKVFKPVIESCGNEILVILENDEELKSEVEKKVQEILQNREKKKEQE